MAKRHIDTIIIHCSKTPPHMDIGAKEIAEWHSRKGLGEIGYHYVIRRSGELEIGRNVELCGVHAVNHNAGSIAICLVGGKAGGGQIEFNYTAAQIIELIGLVQHLKGKHNISKVVGHRDVARTDCPGFNVKEFFSTTDLSPRDT